MKGRSAAVLILGVLALGACEGRDAAAPAPETVKFSHRINGDISGEYRPVGGQGDQPVVSMFVGQEQAFTAWEAGGRGSPPLIIVFNGPEGQVRVTPDTYVVTDGAVQMTGATPDGGVVQVQARIDQGALATARRNLGDQTPVVTGTISKDGRRTAFTLGWWGGD